MLQSNRFLNMKNCNIALEDPNGIITKRNYEIVFPGVVKMKQNNKES